MQKLDPKKKYTVGIYSTGAQLHIFVDKVWCNGRYSHILMQECNGIQTEVVRSPYKKNIVSLFNQEAIIKEIREIENKYQVPNIVDFYPTFVEKHEDFIPLF